MRHTATRSFVPSVLKAATVAVLLGAAATANAAVTTYTATLTGAAEAPPNASPATGFAQVDIDPVAHTMRVQITFAGLLAPNTASHIHGATAVAGTGTAGVATVTPTFTGFPGGVTSGSYDHTFDTTLTGSFNGTFVTNNGGTAASAETALFAAIAAGKSYVNIHSSLYGGGEIRGFLAPDNSTPVHHSTWGRVKSLFR
jgi:hypothetical protein